MNELEKAILRTLAYFDIFDYPLTLLEIWKWLYLPNQNYSLGDVLEVLDGLAASVETKNGFYFFSGRENLVETRRIRYNLAETKFKRALKFIRIFSMMPFVKMIAVCNSLAYSNTAKEGDIDMFIIAQDSRLWLTRLLTVGLLKILGVRPTRISKQDSIDANFFLSENNLNLENAKISANDIYLAYWIDQLVPVFNARGTYEKFQQANAWIKRPLPNALGYQPTNRRRVVNNWFGGLVRFNLKLLFNWDWLEQFVKKFQLKIMPGELKQMMNKDSRVMVSQGMLKFHRHDRRNEYLRKYNEQLSKHEIF